MAFFPYFYSLLFVALFSSQVLFVSAEVRSGSGARRVWHESWVLRVRAVPLVLAPPFAPVASALGCSGTGSALLAGFCALASPELWALILFVYCVQALTFFID